MTAEIMIQTPVEETLCVPLSSVVNPGGQSPEVFVVGQGQVRKVRVRVGEIVHGKIAVSGPLQENDLVVAGGHMALLDGDTVEVVANADL
jgi:multidrug efflux pump subunit AcrA (membrane-fusion protein)